MWFRAGRLSATLAQWSRNASGRRRTTRRARATAASPISSSLVFFVVVVGIGIWLVNAMVDHRKLDDCLATGRRNCAPIDTPAR